MTKLIRLTIAFALIASGGLAAADTAKDYGEKCASCHGVDGKAQTAMGKKLGISDWTDGKTLKAMSDADLTKMIQVGKKLMPGYPTLSADAVKSMVAYVRMLQK